MWSDHSSLKQTTTAARSGEGSSPGRGLLPALSYAVLGLSTTSSLALIAMFVAAMATAVNQVVVSTLRQAAVPDRLLGRVTAAYRLVVLGVVPIGALAGGLVGRWIGVPAVFVCAAVGLTVATAVLAPHVTTRALPDAEMQDEAVRP
ncbi:hypothetical protein ACFQS2_00515 [Brachybacterium sp. GCM10030267]|uniref:hypothetical protein n=1 Tax=Brachybacterium sp. GCM10030267 TaxID=3273381 RepID=UPI00360866DA